MFGIFYLTIFICGTCTVVLGDYAYHQKLFTSDDAFSTKFPDEFQFASDLSLAVPAGHMQQLGKQRPPLGQIPEYFSSPTPSELWNAHVKLYRPAVYRDLLSGSPALSQWNDDYLRKYYGDQEVLIEQKYEDRKTSPKRMLIEAFLREYEKHSWYVVSMLPNVMKKDIKLPKPLMCSSFRANLQELNLWIGTHGTRSMLHYDADNILHCLVSGRKDWILIHPKHKPKSDLSARHEAQKSGYSVINVDKVDLSKNPEIDQVGWEYVSLYAGDCIYLPPQYLHQVRSHNRSISVTFLFYPHADFVDADCKDIDLNSYESLKDAYVYWGYEKDQETVDMGYGNPVKVRDGFLRTCDVLGIQSLQWREFLYVYALSFDLENALELSKEIFRSVDQNADNIVTVEELRNLDVEKWKDICRSTEAPHGPTKTSVNEHPNLSNMSASFYPRRNVYYMEAYMARKFLVELFKKHGKQNLTYPEFKRMVTNKDGNMADGFLLLDKNMDGIIKLDELKTVSSQSLKAFHSLKYSLKDSNDLDSSEDSDDKNDEVGARNVMERLLENIETMTEDHLTETQFHAVFQAVKEFKVHDDGVSFIFKLFNKDNSGFVKKADIEAALTPDDSDDSRQSEIKQEQEEYEGIQVARNAFEDVPVEFNRILYALIYSVFRIQDYFGDQLNAGEEFTVIRDEL